MWGKQELRMNQDMWETDSMGEPGYAGDRVYG